MGGLADFVGIGLHTLALGLGPLTLVQPLIAGGILIAVPLDHALDRRPLRRKALFAVVLGTSGLAGFVLVAQPSGGTDRPGTNALSVALGCCLGVVAVCLLINRYAGPSWRGALLGVAAGVAYAGSGSMVKVSVGLLGRGLGAVLVNWPVYALAAVGGIGLVLNQNAFQTKPLQPALVSMTLATPGASVAIGLLAFREHLAASGLQTAIAVLAAIAMAMGIIGSVR
jgi:drug/metabolite transporter (DMT)-like permease